MARTQSPSRSLVRPAQGSLKKLPSQTPGALPQKALTLELPDPTSMVPPIKNKSITREQAMLLERQKREASKMADRLHRECPLCGIIRGDVTHRVAVLSGGVAPRVICSVCGLDEVTYCDPCFLSWRPGFIGLVRNSGKALKTKRTPALCCCCILEGALGSRPNGGIPGEAAMRWLLRSNEKSHLRVVKSYVKKEGMPRIWLHRVTTISFSSTSSGVGGLCAAPQDAASNSSHGAAHSSCGDDSSWCCPSEKTDSKEWTFIETDGEAIG